ncbi:MAG: folate-binding protein [Hyphomicrobiales bacterium]|nr:folate-binding protein [Hyphomicrobiales bacterium]
MANSSFLMQVRRERTVLGLEGAETENFLHNLVTADILGLAQGAARYAALLTPQGKILFDFFVVKTAEGYLLDCAASQLEELIKRLMFYRLRAKVAIAERKDLEAGVAPTKPQALVAYMDPRTSLMGWRIIAEKGKLPTGTGYDQMRIALGLADSDGDIGSGEMFPHEANLDQLGAVSFSKGCYVGQEVVSRMEHRATARSRILPVTFDGAAPPRGAAIKSGDRIIGSVLSSAGNAALALLRLDRLAETTQPLLTEAVRVHVHKPAWIKYDVPSKDYA